MEMTNEKAEELIKDNMLMLICMCKIHKEIFNSEKFDELGTTLIYLLMETFNIDDLKEIEKLIKDKFDEGFQYAKEHNTKYN